MTDRAWALTQRPPRRGFRVRALARLGAAASVGALAGAVALPATAGAAGNANFIGVWGATTGGWVITSENMTTGACAGTSDYTGYTLTSCKVTGNHYAFTVNAGSSYHSYNTGMIQGNNVTGSFTDTNGTTESYTAVRTVMCIVPKLRGLRLAAAKRALTKANCTVGKITKAKSSRVAKGKVILSRPAAGAQHQRGARVAVVVSRGKH
jgi:hypothetical protein